MELKNGCTSAFAPLPTNPETQFHVYKPTKLKHDGPQTLLYFTFARLEVYVVTELIDGVFGSCTDIDPYVILVMSDYTAKILGTCSSQPINHTIKHNNPTQYPTLHHKYTTISTNLPVPKNTLLQETETKRERERERERETETKTRRRDTGIEARMHKIVEMYSCSLCTNTYSMDVGSCADLGGLVEYGIVGNILLHQNRITKLIYHPFFLAQFHPQSCAFSHALYHSLNLSSSVSFTLSSLYLSF
eukprot:1395299-Amorphochlora_amoeboformis.AAC.1